MKISTWTVCVFLWVGACFHGYFYETEYLLMTFSMIAISFIVAIKSKSFTFIRSYHAPILLMVAMYWISILYAVDRENALLEAIKATSLVPIAYLSGTISDEQRQKIYKAWIWCGAFVTICGIIFQMNRNGRLESTFEYANALAIYLLAAILLAILLFLKQRRKIYFILMAIHTAGLLLTMSRSVWVLWLLALVLLPVLFREARHRTAITLIGMAHAAGFLLAAAVRSDLLFFWQRVKSMQPETSEFRIRLVYWKDSLSIIQEYWLGGTGGGGWSVIQSIYQSQTYYVRYVHNHYIQLAMDIGLIGLVVFLIAIAAFYITGLRRIKRDKAHADTVYWTKAARLIAGIMLLHAGFDFDLAFPLLAGLLFVVMSVPYISGKKPDAKLFSYKPRPPVMMASIVALPLIALVLWVGTGYVLKERALQFAHQQDWEQAQASFKKAAFMLPWSHTILYESAKAFVRQGNETGDKEWLVLADKQLDQAIRLVPKEDLYQSLKIDLNKALTK